MKHVYVYDYRTGQYLGELSPELAAIYETEMWEEDTIAQGVGVVDGERYGYPGRTIYTWCVPRSR